MNVKAKRIIALKMQIAMTLMVRTTVSANKDMTEMDLYAIILTNANPTTITTTTITIVDDVPIILCALIHLAHLTVFAMTGTMVMTQSAKTLMSVKLEYTTVL